MSEELETFGAGGIRTRVKERYDMICPAGTHAEALAMGEGVKYGEQNWTLGFSKAPTGSEQNRKDSIRESLNHALKHINLYLAGDMSEDHLGHAKANLSFAVHFDSECQCSGAVGRYFREEFPERENRTASKPVPIFPIDEFYATSIPPE